MGQRASAFSLLGLVVSVACDPSGEALSLSPALWPEGELQTYLELESTRQLEPPAVTVDNVMMAAMTSATAVRAGYEPVHTTFRDLDLYGAPLPRCGGTHTAEAFNLFELADLPAIGHPTSTPETLFWLLQIATLPELLSPPLAGTFLPGRPGRPVPARCGCVA